MPRRRLSSDPARWRRRAVKLLLTYLLLALTLLSTRSLTRDVRPALLAARTQEKQLTQERDQRELHVQTLLADTRVRQWALQNGMVLTAEAPKTSRDLGTQAVPPLPQAPSEPLKVKIQWN